MLHLLPQSVRELGRPTSAWYAAAAAVTLTLIGVMAIGAAEPDYAAKQLQWLPIALLAMVACMIPHPRVIGMATYGLAAVVLLLLIGLVAPGMPARLAPRINGATSWYDPLALAGKAGAFRFQPSELAKIVFVLCLARYLRFRDSYRTLKGLATPFLMMLVPVALILMQPDLGTALLFAPTLFVVLVAVGAKLRHLMGLVAGAAVIVGVNLVLIFAVPVDQHPILKPHQVKRVKSMVALAQGEADVLGDAYQQNQAMNLIGSGGLGGYGAERSAVIVQFNHLPEDHNDMIFPVIVNRWGLLGGAAIIGLYLVITLSLLDVAARTKDPFGRVACVGFGGLLFTQAMINMAMTVGLLPITGITLPFVSYGGSSLLTAYATIGLVLNFAARRPALITRPSFEFGRRDALAS